MKHVISILSLIFCIYSVSINADQISDELTNFSKALQVLESTISGQPLTPLTPAPVETQPLTPLVPATQPLTPLTPAPVETQPLTPLVPATQPLTPLTPAPVETQPLTPLVPATQPLTPLTPAPVETQPLTPLVPATQPLTPLTPAPVETQPLTPLIPAPSTPTMEEQIKTHLDDLETIQNMLDNFKTVQAPKEIPLSSNDLETWKTELKTLNEDIIFLQQNASKNITEVKEKLIKIKDATVDFLIYLKTLAQTKDQATILLQYIDKFYTKGVAQDQYKNLLGDMAKSNTDIEQLKTDLNAIIFPVTPLVPAPVETQPLIPLEPALSKEQQQEITDLIADLQRSKTTLEFWVDEGDTEKVYDFMSNEKNPKFFKKYYSPQITKYAGSLTSEERKTIERLLNSISIELKSDNMKTLQNRDAFIRDIQSLISYLKVIELATGVD